MTVVVPLNNVNVVAGPKAPPLWQELQYCPLLSQDAPEYLDMPLGVFKTASLQEFCFVLKLNEMIPTNKINKEIR